MEKQKYAVTRQMYWPDGERVVEVAIGGIDYTNPDALCEEYEGEFEEFIDPREAVAVAEDICRKWRKDSHKRISVAVGYTGGFTMPFEPITFKDAEQWAQGIWEELEKCSYCGEILPEEYYIEDGIDEEGFRFCSEHCLYRAIEDLERESNPA